MFDGSRTFVKYGPNPKPLPVMEPQVEVRKGLSIPGDGILLDRSPWFYTKRDDLTVLNEAGNVAPGCSVLRSIQGDGVRIDYHVDPGKDFRIVKQVWWTKAPDGWKKESETVESDFTRLPGGQWYARKEKIVPHQGQRSSVEMLTHVDVLLLDLSETLFSGEELLKGVKKVVTR